MFCSFNLFSFLELFENGLCRFFHVRRVFDSFYTHRESIWVSKCTLYNVVFLFSSAIQQYVLWRSFFGCFVRRPLLVCISNLVCGPLEGSIIFIHIFLSSNLCFTHNFARMTVYMCECLIFSKLGMPSCICIWHS